MLQRLELLLVFLGLNQVQPLHQLEQGRIAGPGQKQGQGPAHQQHQQKQGAQHQPLAGKGRLRRLDGDGIGPLVQVGIQLETLPLVRALPFLRHGEDHLPV